MNAAPATRTNALPARLVSVSTSTPPSVSSDKSRSAAQRCDSVFIPRPLPGA